MKSPRKFYCAVARATIPLILINFTLPDSHMCNIIIHMCLTVSPCTQAQTATLVVLLDVLIISAYLVRARQKYQHFILLPDSSQNSLSTKEYIKDPYRLLGERGYSSLLCTRACISLTVERKRDVLIFSFARPLKVCINIAKKFGVMLDLNICAKTCPRRIQNFRIYKFLTKSATLFCQYVNLLLNQVFQYTAISYLHSIYMSDIYILFQAHEILNSSLTL